ncbi:MAG: ATP-binding protein, partial [Myxococcota bacterium]
MVERLQPLVGRSRELRHLSQALEGVAEGQGSSVLVVGEAGLGKSRLLEASAHGAQGAGFTTAWGRCWEAGEAPAFWPWTQVLRAVLRDRPGAEASLGAYRLRGWPRRPV